MLYIHSSTTAYLGQSLAKAQALADRLQHACLQERRHCAVSLLRRISLSNGSLIFTLDRGNLMQALGSQVARSMSADDSVEDVDIAAPFRLRRRGVQLAWFSGSHTDQKAAIPSLPQPPPEHTPGLGN